MSEIIHNGIDKILSVMQIIFVYGLAILLVIAIIYFFYRLEVEVAKDKANKK